MEVRIYCVDGDAPRYAVEFQKRSGSSSTFGSAYRLAAQFLSTHFPGIQGVPNGGRFEPLPIPHEPEMAALTFEDVAPVLEMAQDTQFPMLQVEAAAALSNIAKQGVTAALPLLQAPEETAAALVKLLATDDPEVVFPAASALHALACVKEASALLCVPGLMQAAADRQVPRQALQAQRSPRRLPLACAAVWLSCPLRPFTSCAACSMMLLLPWSRVQIQ